MCLDSSSSIRVQASRFQAGQSHGLSSSPSQPKDGLICTYRLHYPRVHDCAVARRGDFAAHGSIEIAHAGKSLPTFDLLAQRHKNLQQALAAWRGKVLLRPHLWGQRDLQRRIEHAEMSSGSGEYRLCTSRFHPDETMPRPPTSQPTAAIPRWLAIVDRVPGDHRIIQ